MKTVSFDQVVTDYGRCFFGWWIVLKQNYASKI